MRARHLAAVASAAAVLAGAAATTGADPFEIELSDTPRTSSDRRGATAAEPQGVGDVNGDRRPDFIVEVSERGGASLRVVFGPLPRGRTRLEDRPGFVVRAPAGTPAIRNGPAGDFNGDGLADLVAAYGGTVRVILGSASGDTVPLAEPGGRGVRIDGVDARGIVGNQSLTSGVDGGHDVNGDGLADVVVGSPGSDPGGRRQAGSAFVVLGRRDGAPVEVEALGDGGFRIDGPEERARIGVGVEMLGDAGGDGRADVVVSGAQPPPEWDEDPVYLVHGRGAGPPVDLVSPGPAGFRITNVRGGAVLEAGDVTGDRRADFLVESNREFEPVLVTGAADSDPLDLSAPGPRATVLDGGNLSIAARPGPGDVNGDGLEDLLLRYESDVSSGIRLVFGTRDPGERLRVDRAGGYEIAGPSDAGRYGDADGDGRADLLLRSFRGFDCVEEQGTGNGTLFLLTRAATQPTLPRSGRYTPRHDRLVGTGRPETIFGARGNDALDGRGGNDCLYGGDEDILTAPGDDDVIAARPDDDRIFGGSGDDFLFGGVERDRLDGGRGNDRLEPGSGDDVAAGGPGNDFIFQFEHEFEEPDADRYLGGPGKDEIVAQDGWRDTVDCGPGARDLAWVDQRDRVRNCERVRRATIE